MQKVHFKDVMQLEEAPKRLMTGAELLLTYELDKYLRAEANLTLSTEGIMVDRELRENDHFKFVVANGVDFGYNLPRQELDYSKSVRLYFTGDVGGVAFESVTPTEVVYNFEADYRANQVMHHENRAASYVSLWAYLIVQAYLQQIAIPKLIINHEKYSHAMLEYSELMILQLYGNQWAGNGNVEVKYKKEWGNQPEWEAYVLYERQRGYMRREYSQGEKAQYLAKNFEVGDVVLLYHRARGAENKSITRLESCYPAVIRNITPTQISLEYYPLIVTKLTRKVDLEDKNQALINQGKAPVFQPEDIDRFIVSRETFSLSDIGIGKRTWNERDFILPPMATDGTMQALPTKTGHDWVFLNTLETIYAVFEDQNIDYNKERFLEKYPIDRIADQYNERLN